MNFYLCRNIPIQGPAIPLPIQIAQTVLSARVSQPVKCEMYLDVENSDFI